MWTWCVFCCLVLVLGVQGTGRNSLPGQSQDPILSQDPIPDNRGTGDQSKPNVIEVGGGLGKKPADDAASSDFPTTPPYLPGDTPCFRRAQGHVEVFEDVLAALREGWGQESELRKEDLTRFGVCSHSDGTAVMSALSVLAEEANKEINGLHVLHPTKEFLESEEEEGGRLVMRLHLPRSPLLRLKPVLLLAFGSPIRARDLDINFTSHSLNPNIQTVCISEGTQYLILTGRPSEGRNHQKWLISAETKTPDTGQELSELRGILIGQGAGSNVSMIPLVLFSVDRGTDVRVTPELSPSPAPSATFAFLCELQKFLSDVLPQTHLKAAPVQLDSLHTLPPLSLGVSSSETLLVGLLNSSALTLFSFPRQGSVLQGHRGELALQPALLEVLRLRLEEAVAQMRDEEVGRRGMDRLRRLRELSTLPREGEESPAGVVSSRKTQYRALILLKALQTVLRAWEVERARRAARADKEGPGNDHLCRLHSLTVSLEKYFLDPPTATINNCQGACSFPLTNGNNHAILLNSQIQGGKTLERSPCCVPVDYGDLQVVALDQEETKIAIRPNMVAKECGCR